MGFPPETRSAGRTWETRRPSAPPLLPAQLQSLRHHLGRGRHARGGPVTRVSEPPKNPLSHLGPPSLCPKAPGPVNASGVHLGTQCWSPRPLPRGTPAARDKGAGPRFPHPRAPASLFLQVSVFLAQGEATGASPHTVGTEHQHRACRVSFLVYWSSARFCSLLSLGVKSGLHVRM